MSLKQLYDWLPINSPTFGKVYSPIIPLEVQASNGDWKVFYPEVDSGAIISVFNKYDCEFLGYELGVGKQFSLKGVLGDAASSYIHNLNLKIGNNIIQARIAFTDGKNHKQLLGRVDIFDKFHICLNGRNLKTEIIKE